MSTGSRELDELIKKSAISQYVTVTHELLMVVVQELRAAQQSVHVKDDFSDVEWKATPRPVNPHVAPGKKGRGMQSPHR